MRHQQNRAPREDGEFGLEHECSSGSLVVPEPEQARLASGRRRGKRYLWCALVASLAMLMLTQSQGWPAGAANCQPSSLKHKQQRRHLQQQQQQRQSPQQEHLARANAATSGRSQTSSSCSPNCLAIPLVTIMGHKRLDGFLLSGSQRKPVSANLAHVGSASEYPAGAGWIHYIGDASSSSSSSSKAPSALYNKRPPYLNTLDLPMSDHMSTRPPHLVELPRSDEKCPMTGPMTVCDQIGSYPAELILSKLASVKEILRSSNFNLDSMFTDEREHSSDPFEDISSSSPSINETRQQHRPASLISSPVHPNIDRIPLHPANQREQPTRRNYRSSMAEFVDLVERSAIRLDSSRRPPSAAYLKRARRQLDSVVSLSSTASSSSSMSTPKPNVQVLAAAGFQSGSSQAEPQDPERVTSFAGPTPEPICRARSTYISPRAALNDKKQWKYVVNAPERSPQIKQIIRVDICEDPFGPCSSLVSLPFGFSSQCKQKYSKKKLLALNSESNQLEVDTFFVPSCCVCQLIINEPDSSGGIGDSQPPFDSTTSTPDLQPETTTDGSS